MTSPFKFVSSLVQARSTSFADETARPARRLSGDPRIDHFNDERASR